MAQALSGSYATVRRFLPTLLGSLEFEGAPSAKHLLDAWHFLQVQEASGRSPPKWAAAPRTVVPKGWAGGLFPAKGEVNSPAYTLCVLDQLDQALRRREVFVVGSEWYGNPRAELLRAEQWEVARDSVARALDRSTDPVVEMGRLPQQLGEAYREVSENLAQNTALELRQQNGEPYVVVSPLAAQQESPSLQQLRVQLVS